MNDYRSNSGERRTGEDATTVEGHWVSNAGQDPLTPNAPKRGTIHYRKLTCRAYLINLFRNSISVSSWLHPPSSWRGSTVEIFRTGWVRTSKWLTEKQLLKTADNDNLRFIHMLCGIPRVPQEYPHRSMRCILVSAFSWFERKCLHVIVDYAVFVLVEWKFSRWELMVGQREINSICTLQRHLRQAVRAQRLAWQCEDRAGSAILGKLNYIMFVCLFNLSRFYKTLVAGTRC